MPSSRKASLLVVFLTVFIDLLGFGMVLPLLPLYGQEFTAQLGLGERQTGWIVGLLMASFSAMQFLFLPVWGRVSDRIGRRPVILLGLVGSTFFYALFGVAAAWRSLPLLFVARIGAGIACATISTAQAYIADVTTRETRAKGMALIGAAFALGFTLGPLLGSAALLAGGDAAFSPWPGYVAAGFSGVALLLAIVYLGESRPAGAAGARHALLDRTALRAVAAAPSVGTLIFASFISVFSFANLETTLSMLVNRIVATHQEGGVSSGLLSWAAEVIRGWGYTDREQISLIVVLAVFTYLGGVLTLAQGFLVRRLAGRISETRMATIGGLGAIVGFVLCALATAELSIGLVLLGLAIEVTGFAFVTPSLQSLISRRSDPAHQGGVLGLSQSASALARILGALCGPGLFALSPTWPFWLASGLMLAGLGLIVWAAGRGRDFAGATTPAEKRAR